MVESKNYSVKMQLALVVLIPVTPHIKISNIFQLDDIPILLFFAMFVINIFLKNINKFYFKEIIPISLFITYISIQNYFINGNLFFSDVMRYIFYLILLITVLNLKNSKFLDKYFFSLLVFFESFFYIFIFFKIRFWS